MARKKKVGDVSHNARRRYTRKAERYLKQAESAIGATKARLESLAQQEVEKAVTLYEDKSKIGSTFRNLAKRVNVDIDKESTLGRVAAISESYKSLKSAELDFTSPEFRTQEAKVMLGKGNIKARFYGGLNDIWEGLPPEQRDSAILEAYGAESLLDVLEELEKAGIDLFKTPDNDKYYDEVLPKIAAHTAKKTV